MTTRLDVSRHLQLSPGAPTKTFVLDVHADDPATYLAELAGQADTVEPTDDAFLFHLVVPSGDFWVDQLDERFWSFHTDMPAADAKRYLNAHIESRRDLDWVWLPSQHLQDVWPGARARGVRTDFRGRRFLSTNDAAQDLRLQASGSDAAQLLDYIASNDRWKAAVSLQGVQVELSDTDLGVLTEAVHRMGRFSVSGDSFEFHVQFVRHVVQRYRNFVTACEERSFRWTAFDEAGEDGGGTVSGSPITMRFSRPIPDLDGFLDELFSARQPIRLWGIPTIEDGFASIEAVDLHVGQRLRIDIGRDWLRVYLNAGSCGNTVARMVSNLQHRFDGALRLVDEQLAEALTGHAGALGNHRN